MSATGYRPPNWGTQPQLYSITCTLPSSSPSSASNNTGTNSTAPQGTPTTYFFDATERVEHVQEAVLTEHPVQVGPALVDHIYLKAARLTLEVAISDAMQSYQSGQYSGTSRSVSAFQTFQAIQAARVPITVSTRLKTYQNMGLEMTGATETHATFRSFRGVLRFRQIISAQVQTTTVSARSDTTNTTNEGTKAPESVPPDVQNLLNNMPAPMFNQ